MQEATLHIVEETSLVEFYQLYLEQLRVSGKKALILALVREADEPAFYADVVRYWTSLHDLTGDKVVFAVAAPHAAEKEEAHQYISVGGEQRKDIHSPLFAERGGFARSSMTPSQYATMASHLADFAARSHLSVGATSDDLARANTSQISSLRDHLGLSESQLPCLHLTLFTEPTKTAALPLISFNHFSIYSACREIMVALDAPLRLLGQREAEYKQDVAAITKPADALSKELASVDGVIRRLRDDRNPRVERAYGRLEQQIKGDLAPQVRAFMELCESGFQDDAVKAEARRRAEILSKIEPRNRELSSAMRSLIDMVSDAKYIRSAPERAAQMAEAERRHRELMNQMQNVNRKTASALTDLEKTYTREIERVDATLAQAFDALAQAKSLQIGPDEWDAFISYARPDIELAEHLFRLLGPSNRVFFDRYCLQPGERWRDKIPDVQGRARATIPLVSDHSAAAHYQQSEIERAINLNRAGHHAIYPVLSHSAAQIPFGLEQFQALVLNEHNVYRVAHAIKSALGVNADARASPMGPSVL